MNIGFFISNHGFGHVMRNLPVMAELMSRGHNVVLICGQKQCEIAKSTDKNIITIQCDTDLGLVLKDGTLIVDEKETIYAVRKYVESFPELEKFGENVIKEYQIDRVVSDIVPWALSAAHNCGVLSVIMASFTWVEQYEKYMPAELVEAYAKAYQLADKVLYYNLVNEPTIDLLGEGIEVGYVARPYSEIEVSKIRANHQRKIVFVSIGASNNGLNFDIDVSELPYDFIVTEGIKFVGNNVTYLDRNIPNTQDYVKAADYCISKAGWTTVAELMIAGTKFGVLKRPDVPEDTMTINQLIAMNAAISIDVDELRNIGDVISRLELTELDNYAYENRYRQVADEICL